MATTTQWDNSYRLVEYLNESIKELKTLINRELTENNGKFPIEVVIVLSEVYTGLDETTDSMTEFKKQISLTCLNALAHSGQSEFVTAEVSDDEM